MVQIRLLFKKHSILDVFISFITEKYYPIVFIFTTTLSTYLRNKKHILEPKSPDTTLGFFITSLHQMNHGNLHFMYSGAQE